MIEKIIYDYLTQKLAPTKVYMEIPSDAPSNFVVVEKTSSSRENLINSATFAFQSYADSMYNASQLNELVKQALDDSVELDAISSAKLNSDYNYTDTTTKHYRYQCVYDFIHY